MFNCSQKIYKGSCSFSNISCRSTHLEILKLSITIVQNVLCMNVHDMGTWRNMFHHILKSHFWLSHIWSQKKLTQGLNWSHSLILRFLILHWQCIQLLPGKIQRRAPSPTGQFDHFIKEFQTLKTSCHPLLTLENQKRKIEIPVLQIGNTLIFHCYGLYRIINIDYLKVGRYL